MHDIAHIPDTLNTTKSSKPKTRIMISLKQDFWYHSFMQLHKNFDIILNKSFDIILYKRFNIILQYFLMFHFYHNYSLNYETFIIYTHSRLFNIRH